MQAWTCVTDFVDGVARRAIRKQLVIVTAGGGLFGGVDALNAWVIQFL
jgi:hypothetical protein